MGQQTKRQTYALRLALAVLGWVHGLLHKDVFDGYFYGLQDFLSVSHLVLLSCLQL